MLRHVLITAKRRKQNLQNRRSLGLCRGFMPQEQRKKPPFAAGAVANCHRTGKERTKDKFAAFAPRSAISSDRPHLRGRSFDFTDFRRDFPVGSASPAGWDVQPVSPKPFGTGRSGKVAARFCRARPITTRLISVVPSTIRSICASRDKRSRP